MNQPVDKRNYDVVSLSQPGKTKRANTIRHAMIVDSANINRPGSFVKVFSDIFLAKESSYRAIK